MSANHFVRLINVSGNCIIIKKEHCAIHDWARGASHIETVNFCLREEKKIRKRNFYKKYTILLIRLSFHSSIIHRAQTVIRIKLLMQSKHSLHKAPHLFNGRLSAIKCKSRSIYICVFAVSHLNIIHNNATRPLSARIGVFNFSNLPSFSRIKSR